MAFLEGIAQGLTDVAARKEICSRDSIARWKRQPEFKSAYGISKIGGKVPPRIRDMTSEELTETFTEMVKEIPEVRGIVPIDETALVAVKARLEQPGLDLISAQEATRLQIQQMIPLALDRLLLILADAKTSDRELLSAIKLVAELGGLDENIRPAIDRRQQTLIQTMQVYVQANRQAALDAGVDVARLLNHPKILEGEFKNLASADDKAEVNET